MLERFRTRVEINTNTFKNLSPAPPLAASEKQEGMHAEELRGQLSRRELLLKAAKVGIVLGGSAYQLNSEVTEVMWPDSPAGVREIPADVPRNKIHNATFVFGGLGTRDSSKESESLTGALQEIGRVVAVVFRSNKLGLSEVGNHMNRYISKHRIKEINIYGDSMGGIAGVHTLPEIDMTLNGGVHVNNIIEDCTPITQSNVRKEDAPPLEYLAKNGFHGGGFLGKGLAQLITHFDNWTDYLDIKKQLEHSWQRTLDNTSPALWMDQLKLVADSSVEQFAQCLSTVNYEQMYYIRPRDAEHDNVVYDIAAIGDLTQANKLAKDIRRKHKKLVSDAQVKSIRIPGITHASCIANPDRYTYALRTVLLPASE